MIQRPVVPEPSPPKAYRNESALRDAARKYLSTIKRSKVIKHHGEAMSEAGIPDTQFVWLGMSIWFEWKLPGRGGRRIQDVQIRRLIHAGSPAFIATSLRDIKDALDTIIGERFIVVDGRPAWLIV